MPNLDKKSGRYKSSSIMLKIMGFCILVTSAVNLMLGIKYCRTFDFKSDEFRAHLNMTTNEDRKFRSSQFSHLGKNSTMPTEGYEIDLFVKSGMQENLSKIKSSQSREQVRSDEKSFRIGRQPHSAHVVKNHQSKHNKSILPESKKLLFGTVANSSTRWQNSFTPDVIHRMDSRFFPSEFSSFDDLLKINNTVGVPQNLHLVFVGDSLTRYQYLSLVYFLKFGEFVNPADTPNMLREKDHVTWYDFFQFTSTKLQPHEQCDCFRPEGHKMPLMLENRYFNDLIHNNSISYIQKFGHKFTFKSNWPPSNVQKNHALIRREEDNNYVLDTLNWPELITNFVAKLDPKPLYFVFNQGIHPHRDFSTRKVRRQIINAIKENGMISIYKTTTKYRDHDIEVNGINETDAIREYEVDLCKRADYCLDLSWTWLIPKSYYTDYAHFDEPVYSWQNLQLLDILNANKNKLGGV